MADQTASLPTAFAAYDDDAMVWVVFAKPRWTGGIHRAVRVFEDQESATTYATFIASDPIARQTALDNA